ncbi:hypothetical protein T265_07104 [Opisthorchis viverrini]|uniref:Uncharacterized protein n=1 Tax=Opisthorchis viverrini TaxID=6198 RepID=A0A074ZI10_OPIVI|nr:hypothetical protein T265_07104 [Opisthorchis viverrini]KER25422.1 hypothetical protein T265_07104 [Opisthorchis viverrini]
MQSKRQCGTHRSLVEAKESFRRNTLLIMLLKALRQPTTNFIFLGSHQIGAITEFSSTLCALPA